MKDELEKLKEEIRFLKSRNRIFSIIFISFLTIVVALSFSVNEKGSFDRITAKEIIVIDEHGNERIIMSSSISTSKSRLRADTLEGILMLDKNGTDRIVLGATPTIQSNGNIVRRVENSKPIGLTFNDSLGNERGGFGFYDSRGLVSFGMDNQTGEGLTMFVADDNLYGQKVGLVMNSDTSGQVVYLGSSQDKITMLNLDIPDKGRLSIKIDSTASSTIEHFDYMNNTNSVLVKSK